MKIALAQLNYHIGDFEFNTRRIIEAIRQAGEAGADLVVFAELSVCGYPPRDFLEFDDFIRKSAESISKIAAVCNGIAAVVGAPSANFTGKGKPLFNTAFLLADGSVQGTAVKTLLPNYDVFDEYRYFEPNPSRAMVIPFKGLRLAVTICEDLWNVGDDPLYMRNPMEEMLDQAPDLMINIAASPFHYRQAVVRTGILMQNVNRYGIPLVYVNQVGGQTELIFDGGSMMVGKDGRVTGKLAEFSEDLAVFEVPGPVHDTAENLTATIAMPPGPDHSKGNYSDSGTTPDQGPVDFSTGIDQIHDALVLGIRDYFGKMGFSKAILGLSGGIDSALTLVLASEALGNKNVTGILLPSRYSTEHSVEDAKRSARLLDVEYRIIPIEEAFKAFENSLETHFAGLPSDLTEENIQARIRAVILMALSNKFGYILLNTSNKSEAAVGYGTLYGDMCGGLSVLGDVYKTQVYHLAHYINRAEEIIPVNSILKPPSAELRPGQKDSDSLPEYGILDEILYKYIELRMGPNELVAEGYPEPLIKRILKLVNTSEYKRHQTPPILRVSPKAFGMGRRMPMVGKYLS